MHNKTELGVLGVILVLLGFGTCIVASFGFIDQNVAELPLGPAEEHVEEASRSTLGGPVAGLVMVLVGVVLVSLSGARDQGTMRQSANSASHIGRRKHRKKE